MTCLLVASASSAVAFQWAACASVGGAVFLVIWLAVRALASEDLRQGMEWRYDISRINALRRIDVTFRLFQPLIQWLGRINRGLFRESMPEMQRQIQAAGLPRFWLAEEYLARAEIYAMLLLPVYTYLFVSQAGARGAVPALAMSAATVWLLRHRLASQAAQRLKLIKRRMPFLLDLLTLLMEAGSTFLNALIQSVSEFEGHPVAEEFGRVLNDMNLGKTRSEAFQGMRDRLNDDEITSIIGSILQGEHLGTPLAQIFRTQADVLRLKRTQRAEMVAGEAGVNMLLPGILVMASTVLIIVGPFLLNYLNSGFAM